MYDSRRAATVAAATNLVSKKRNDAYRNVVLQPHIQGPTPESKITAPVTSAVTQLPPISGRTETGKSKESHSESTLSPVPSPATSGKCNLDILAMYSLSQPHHPREVSTAKKTSNWSNNIR